MHDCTYLPTATTLQKHPSVYHTTRYTTILIRLQQPPYNNTHLSTMIPETQLYLSAYSNHLTITPISLPYYQTQLYFPVNSNHISITSTCLPYYHRYNYTHLPSATTFINLASLPFKRNFYKLFMPYSCSGSIYMKQTKIKQNSVNFQN